MGYLLLSGDAEGLADSIGWGEERLSSRASSMLAPLGGESRVTLRSALRPLIRAYLELLRTGGIAALAPDTDAVAKAQKLIAGRETLQRYYELYVTALATERVLGDSRALAYPSITLASLFAEQPEVLSALESARNLREKRWQEVRGPYTQEAFRRVVANVYPKTIGAPKPWVIPESDSKGAGTRPGGGGAVRRAFTVCSRPVAFGVNGCGGWVERGAYEPTPSRRPDEKVSPQGTQFRMSTIRRSAAPHTSTIERTLSIVPLS
jgi:hypothetical protein